MERMAAGRCEVTGIPFDLSPPPPGATTNPFAPSVDRKDSSRGYEPGNCQLVVWVHNIARQNYGDHAVRRYARALNRAAMGLPERS